MCYFQIRKTFHFEIRNVLLSNTKHAPFSNTENVLLTNKCRSYKYENLTYILILSKKHVTDFQQTGRYTIKTYTTQGGKVMTT